MGKRNIDHDTNFETPHQKKRRTESVAVEPSPPAAADIVDGVILTDLCSKKWRCGKPIGELNCSQFSERFIMVNNNLQLIPFYRQRQFRRNILGI